VPSLGPATEGETGKEEGEKDDPKNKRKSSPAPVV